MRVERSCRTDQIQRNAESMRSMRGRSIERATVFQQTCWRILGPHSCSSRLESRASRRTKSLTSSRTCCFSRSRQRIARSEEHTSELQSLMRISYAVFCLKKKNKRKCRQYQNRVDKQEQYKIDQNMN